MGILSSLLGRRPKIPEGASYWIDDHLDKHGVNTYVIRLKLANEDQTPACKKEGPTFTTLVEAGKYRDWLNGGPDYVYPKGQV